MGHLPVEGMYEQNSANTPHANLVTSPSLAGLSYLVVREIKQFAGQLFSTLIHSSIACPSVHHVQSHLCIERVGVVFSLPGLSEMFKVDQDAVDALLRWSS